MWTRLPLPTFAREIGAFVVHTNLRKHQISTTLTLQPYALAFINKLSAASQKKNRFADANVVTGFHVIPDFMMEQKILSKTAQPRQHHKKANIASGQFNGLVNEYEIYARQIYTYSCMLWLTSSHDSFYSSVRVIIFSHFAVPTFPTFRIETEYQEPVLFPFFYSH